MSVFIHRSIKTRIETSSNPSFAPAILSFLYIDPLKQGLKHRHNCTLDIDDNAFLYIDPLKQGLKPAMKNCMRNTNKCFYT